MSRWKRYTPALLLAAVIVLAAVWFLKPVGHEFDPTVWKDQTKVGSGVRQGMADRLVAHKSLIGMSRDQIEDMLGPPEERSTETWIVYNLGPDLGFMGIDGKLLIVELENGKVARCRVITT